MEGMVMHEILKSSVLLDENGNINEPGFARTLILNYNRAQVKGGYLRLKEWDYYLVCNEHFAVALTIADNSYMGLDSISFLRFDEKTEKTVSKMQVLTRGKKQLPTTSKTGDVQAKGKGYQLSFIQDKGKRILDFHMADFDEGMPIKGQITLWDEPKESMVIATPFEKKGHFYYNQKINCMNATGTVNVCGKDYLFSEEDSFGVLDWGRGVWTYKNTWYWGSASGLVDGIKFGFNIGYGFGNTQAATENVLFYDGVIHKLSEVKFEIPCKKDGVEEFDKQWKFSSDDGRFELDFVPVLDRAACLNALIIASDQHQVFGYFSGKVILDNGKVIQLDRFFGFAEKVMNKW